MPALLFLAGFHPSPHPLYVSITEITHNTKDQSLEISCRMFTDDLENTVNRIYKTRADLTRPSDSAAVVRLLNNYITTHLQIKTDDSKAVFQMIGFERENGAIWCHLQGNGISSFKKIEVVNDLLYESFDSQMGIMHVLANGKRKSLRLNNPDKIAAFDF
ncbi:MAG: hypothetical protein H7Y03_08745 [Chitinophagaceae bacterium]|nr:hypothetical protein [Chitinophagaceae bacterium]